MIFLTVTIVGYTGMKDCYDTFVSMIDTNNLHDSVDKFNWFQPHLSPHRPGASLALAVTTAKTQPTYSPACTYPVLMLC